MTSCGVGQPDILKWWGLLQGLEAVALPNKCRTAGEAAMVCEHGVVFGGNERFSVIFNGIVNELIVLLGQADLGSQFVPRGIACGSQSQIGMKQFRAEGIAEKHLNEVLVDFRFPVQTGIGQSLFIASSSEEIPYIQTGTYGGVETAQIVQHGCLGLLSIGTETHDEYFERLGLLW